MKTHEALEEYYAEKHDRRFEIADLLRLRGSDWLEDVYCTDITLETLESVVEELQ